MKNRLVPFLVGALFLGAAIGKLVHPGPATMALEVLGLPYGWAKTIVAGTTVLELYLGIVLLRRLDLKYGIIGASALLLTFTFFLFYLTTLAHPPSCGCLGLAGIFRNSRHEAVLGLFRNCAILWALQWSYGCSYPRTGAPVSVQTSCAQTLLSPDDHLCG